MADEKGKIVTDATGPDAGPAPAQPEAGGGAPSPQAGTAYSRGSRPG